MDNEREELDYLNQENQEKKKLPAVRQKTYPSKKIIDKAKKAANDAKYNDLEFCKRILIRKSIASRQGRITRLAPACGKTYKTFTRGLGNSFFGDSFQERRAAIYMKKNHALADYMSASTLEEYNLFLKDILTSKKELEEKASLSRNNDLPRESTKEAIEKLISEAANKSVERRKEKNISLLPTTTPINVPFNDNRSIEQAKKTLAKHNVSLYSDDFTSVLRTNKESKGTAIYIDEQDDLESDTALEEELLQEHLEEVKPQISVTKLFAEDYAEIKTAIKDLENKVYDLPAKLEISASAEILRDKITDVKKSVNKHMYRLDAGILTADESLAMMYDTEYCSEAENMLRDEIIAYQDEFQTAISFLTPLDALLNKIDIIEKENMPIQPEEESTSSESYHLNFDDSSFEAR